MRKFLKWTGIVLLVIIALLFGYIFTHQHRKFDAPYPNVKSSNDSAVIARGQHLVFGPAHCANCHSSPDMEDRVANGEIVPLAGGQVFDLPIGKIYTKNLTPHRSGIGYLKDEEIARILRYGVGADGRALLDFMPFHNTSDDDLTAIISFLRHQPAVKNEVPANKLNLLGKAVNAFLLKPAGPSGHVAAVIKRDTSSAYGEYLANSVANCRGCHTDRNLMTGAFTGKDYAGGLTMETLTDSGKYLITTPNLTPGRGGRLNGWTKQQFIDRFRKGVLIPQTHMPWGPFSRMTDDELKAIYCFLQTVKPVSTEVKPTVVIDKN
jgi:mono/diheme cytochrome c family protein